MAVRFAGVDLGWLILGGGFDGLVWRISSFATGVFVGFGLSMCLVCISCWVYALCVRCWCGFVFGFWVA